MTYGLTITAVDPDPDYLGIEIHVCNARFVGSTWIYAGLTDLTDLATLITGYPTNFEDERSYQFGTREPGFAGGFCGIRLRCLDRAGHVSVTVDIEDDGVRYGPASARVLFNTEPAAIDRFADALREVELSRAGEAVLLSA